MGSGRARCLLLSKAEIVQSGPPASVDSKRGGCGLLLPLQEWHHSVEAPLARPGARRRSAAAAAEKPAVTLGEDRRVPRCSCGMLGSPVLFFLRRGGVCGVGV